MCDSWKTSNINCEGIELNDGIGEYTVKGQFEKKSIEDPIIVFWAANPANYLTSFAGSGLPYPNPEVAYDNTPNKGAVRSINGKFEFKVHYPNAYYIGLGSVYVEPCVHYKICGEGYSDKVNTINLGYGIPFRSLTYSPTAYNVVPRSGPDFYAGRDKLPVKSQWKRLVEGSYPEKNIMPDNFWGLSVPQK